MAKRVRIKWDLSAFEEVRRLPAVEKEIDEAAEAVADEANSLSNNAGYLAVSGDGATRSRAAVVAPTPESAWDNAENNTMIKAMATVVGTGDYEVYTSKSGRVSLITKNQAENYRRKRRQS